MVHDERGLLPAVEVFLGSWYFLNVIWTLVGLGLFYTRRRVFPCDQRGFIAVFVMNVAGLFYAIIYPFFVRSCLLDYSLFLFGSVVLAVWVLRSWNLLFRFHLQEVFFRVSKLRDSAESVACIRSRVVVELQNWFVRNRKLCRFRPLAIAMTILVVLNCCMVSLSVAVSGGKIVNPPVNYTCRGWDGGLLYIFSSCLMATELLLGLGLAYALRGFAADAYKLRLEMVVCGGSLLITLLLYQAVRFGLPMLIPYGVGEFLGLSGVTALSVTSLWWPLYMTRAQSATAIEASLLVLKAQAARDMDFASFLSSNDWRDSWHRFLLSEWSLENILFWEAATTWRADLAFELEHQRKKPLSRSSESLRKTPRKHRRLLTLSGINYDEGTRTHSRTHAQNSTRDSFWESGSESESEAPHEIQNTFDEAMERYFDIIKFFLRSDAAQEVNVSASVKAALCEHTPESLAQLDEGAFLEVFDAAIAQIFKLMETDSWPRYQRSRCYAKLLEQRAKNNSQPEHRIVSALSASKSRSVSHSYSRHARGPSIPVHRVVVRAVEMREPRRASL